MSKITFTNVRANGNGGDGIHIVGENDITMSNVETSNNKESGIRIINNQFLKENGLNLTLESQVFQDLIAELKKMNPENRQSTIIQRLAPYLGDAANITTIVTGILSLIPS